MNITKKDKLDILIYNIFNDKFDDRKINKKLKSITDCYEVSTNYIFERYKWLVDMKIDPNKIHLEENHILIYKIFDNYNTMLNENKIEYYYTSGILSYLLADKDLERYHHDLDIFINMNDLKKVEQICNDYNFSFERKLGIRNDGTKRIMLKMYYSDVYDIPITVFMYIRKNDNSIIQKDYYLDDCENKYVEYLYNSPTISELSFSNIPHFHNGIKYYSITPEALFLCKNGNRPKDIYDCEVFKHIIDYDKLVKLKDAFNNNLPNTILEAKDDPFSNFIFKDYGKKVLVKK